MFFVLLSEEADVMYGGNHAETGKNSSKDQPVNSNIELRKLIRATATQLERFSIVFLYRLTFDVDIAEFCDNTAKFFCRVYFAEEFRKLRKLIFPEGEERYVLCEDKFTLFLWNIEL